MTSTNLVRTVGPLVAALLVGAVTAGCDLLGTAGSGEVVEETPTVEAFDQVEASHAFHVSIRAGESHEVVLRVDDNLRDVVEAEVRGGWLHLGVRPGTSVRDATLEADVTMPELRALDASGASRITLVEHFRAGELTVSASGASHVDGNVTAGQLDVVASGASTVQLAGEADEVDAGASGASTLDLEGLHAGVLHIELSGASEGTVTVRDTLDAVASGASSLRFAGEATVVRADATGASSISER